MTSASQEGELERSVSRESAWTHPTMLIPRPSRSTFLGTVKAMMEL